MKTILSFSLLLLPFLVISQTTYWVESAQLDSLILTIKHPNQKNQYRKSIKSTRVDKTQFFFELEQDSNSFLQLYCNTCEETVEFTILNFKNNTHTEVITVRSGELTSITDCFETHAVPSGLWRFLSNPLGYIKKFIGYNQTNLLARRRTQVLRGSDNPSSTDPKMYFDHSDYSYYTDLKDIAIPFKIFDNYTIKSIYILSHEGELILSAGSKDILEDIFDLSNQQFPPIESLLLKEQMMDRKQSFLLDASLFQSYLKEPIQTGQWYQLGIQLNNDSSEFNPYLFNFQLLSKSELQELETFIEKAKG